MFGYNTPSASEMEPVLDLWPVTRPDPTRSLSVCALNWEIILTTVCY